MTQLTIYTPQPPALLINRLEGARFIEVQGGGIHRRIWSWIQVGRDKNGYLGSLSDLTVPRQMATLWTDEGKDTFHLSYSTLEGVQVVVDLPFSALPQAVDDLRAAGFGRKDGGQDVGRQRVTALPAPSPQLSLDESVQPCHHAGINQPPPGV